MEQFMGLKMRNCCSILTLASVVCAVFFQGVTCQDENTTLEGLIVKSETLPGLQSAPGRGDSSDDSGQIQVEILPTLQDWLLSTASPGTELDETSQSTESTAATEPDGQQDTQTSQLITTKQPIAEPSITQGLVVCVDEAAVRGKEAVRLKLKTSSSCEENRAKIHSILEHLCGDDSKLEIYQQDHTDEMIVSGQCIQADAKGMTDKFNNDNIKDKVGVVEAEPVLVKHSRTVLISVLLAGLLLAALLIAAYLLKTHRPQTKGVRLAEEMYQVDEPNQGNTLLSVAPLPAQEPLDKPTSNGESPESPPPTNGHSATQTPVADSQM